MSFLAQFILVLCISTVIGLSHESKPAKTVKKDTVLEANDRIIHQKEEKTHEFKDNGSHKGTSANRKKSLSQKPKQADTEVKLKDGDYKISKTNPKFDIPNITIMSKKTDPGTAIDNNKIAENHSKALKENNKNRSTNIITVLLQKIEQNNAELKANNKNQKRPGDLTNDNLELNISDGQIRNARSTNDVTIVSEHNNLLSLLIDVAHRVMQFRRFSISQQNWIVVSALFEGFLSILFGPNVQIWWPLFTRILVTVMKVLT